jgi:hypothetical protein
MLHPFLDNSIRWLDKIEGRFLLRRAKRHRNWHMAMTDTPRKIETTQWSAAPPVSSAATRIAQKLNVWGLFGAF